MFTGVVNLLEELGLCAGQCTEKGNGFLSHRRTLPLLRERSEAQHGEEGLGAGDEGQESESDGLGDPFVPVGSAWQKAG